ncbi:hypothetical protein H4R99_007200 [Coemansia sp. RSA 1722]|nr:hypothetical protein H4R99_007200 [Coemansia sp. RSA 1722]
MPPRVYWNGRFSSGPVWNEYLSLLLDFNLDNHAVGLAKSETVHRMILNLLPLDPPTTEDQIAEFATNLQLGNTAPLNPLVDIAVLEIGSNDANSAFVEVPEGDLTIYEFAHQLSDIVVGQLQSLSDLGFRKILVTNLPSLQHAPIVRAKQRTDMAQVAVSYYNRLLKEKTDSWRQSVGEDLDLFDIVELGGFVDIAIRPSVSLELGITDTVSYCVAGPWVDLFNDQLSLTKFMRYLVSSDSNAALCDDPGTRFFWDPVHPSERVHRLFAYHIYNTLLPMVLSQADSNYELSESGLIELIRKHKLDEPAPKPASI